VDFLQHDGKPVGASESTDGSRAFTLADYQARYLTTPRDSLEARTIEGIELHFKHLTASLGKRFPIRELNLATCKATWTAGSRPRVWVASG
jgi:hypothetical protein